MSFSEQFISIMDAVSQKFGVVIDWTAENVIPYLTGLGTRVVNYEIATSIVTIIILALVLFAFISIMKNAIKKRWDELFIILFGFSGGIAAICSAMGIVNQVYNIIKAVFLPEMVIIQFLNQFL